MRSVSLSLCSLIIKIPWIPKKCNTLEDQTELTKNVFQTPQYINESAESHKQIDALIEHKCKQLSKVNSGTKGNAIHLEQWMKGELGRGLYETPDDDDEPEPEVWSEEMLRKRSEELNLLDSQGSTKTEPRRSDSRCEEITLSDHEQSPSRSTTTESQVSLYLHTIYWIFLKSYA